MGNAYMGQDPGECVVISFRGRFDNLVFAIPVVIKRGSYIPYIDVMQIPGTSNHWFSIN